MFNNAQGSTVRTAAIAVFVVVFVLLLLIGYSFIAALLFALVLAAAAVAFLLSLRNRGVDPLDSLTSGRVDSVGHGRESTDALRVDPIRAEPERVAPAPPPAAPADVPTPASPLMAPAAGAIAPSRLDMPRAGNPDDLKRIKGVGPKIEDLLHRMGVFHLDQIAAWGPGEIAWMDTNLEGFHGRVSRDDWVGQAKLLATGGETDFSRRVDDGEVY